MAEVLTTRHLVKPACWRDSPFTDAYHFDLEVILRNAGVDLDEPEEWSVSERGREGYGFTAAGKQVSLRGSDRLNRRHAVFSEADALQLAQDLADGKIPTRAYRTLASAIEQWNTPRPTKEQ